MKKTPGVFSLARPVISVGNLAMGGRGKTPVVCYLAKLLLAAGEFPSILSRGYGRDVREDGVVVVSDGRRLLADLGRSGDEPLMMARDVPGAAVLVCDVRSLAGVLAERVLGSTVHVLDDGFQHRALARDLDLVLVRPEDLGGRRLPFGRLRESPRALESADAILVDDGSGGTGSVKVGDRPVFALRRSLGPAAPLACDHPPVDRAAPVFAVAGIAEPARFTRSLEAAGWQVAGTLGFPDHHRYSVRDLTKIAAAAAAVGARAVVTTAKDAMRLLLLRPLPMPVAWVPLAIAIEPRAKFDAWVLDRLRKARA